MGNKIKDNLKEAKEKAVNAVKAFFKFLKDFAFRNSIAEKLEEIEAQLQNGIENDLYTQEQLKKLTNTMDSLAGQLRNMSPEAMKETAEKAMKEVENLIEEMYDDGRILADVNEEDFFTAMKNISGHGDMTNEQFREFFEQNAKLYDNGGMKLENGQVEGKTSMLIEIGKECYQATFDVSEPKPSEKDPNKKVRDYTLKVDKFDGSYSNAKEITSKADITKHETMLRKFILPRNLRRREDIERLDISKLVKTSVAIRDVQTIEKFSSKINESQDGKFEFFYDKKSNTFRARDKETGTALVAGMKKGELFLVPAENMSDIRDLSSEKMSRDRSIFRHEAGKGIIDFNISGMTDAQMNLFRTPEFMQFLETKGIPTEEMKYQLETSDNPEKKPRGYSKVSRKGLQNVDAVYRALYQVVSSDESAFDTRAIRDSRKFAKGSLDGAVYLSVNDKDGNMMSFSFEKDGTPRDINYRAKGGKFKLAQNLNRRGNYGANYETLRYDESFAKLFDTFKTAYNLYEKRTRGIQKEPVQNIKKDEVDFPDIAEPIKKHDDVQKLPDTTDLRESMNAEKAQDVNEYAEQLLRSTLDYLSTNGKDVQELSSDTYVGYSSTSAGHEAVKAVLLDYEVEKGDIDKLLNGKGLKSKRQFENMKEDLASALNIIIKETPEQETDKDTVPSEPENNQDDFISNDDMTID